MVKRHILLYFVCLPWDLFVAWPLIVIIRLLWGKDLYFEFPTEYVYEKGGGGGPCLTCQIKPGTFPVVEGTFPRGWYYNKRTKSPWAGTALGHAIFYGPNGRHGDAEWTRTQAHEHVHVEQFECSMVGSFIVGLAAGIVMLIAGHHWVALGVFLGIWFSGCCIKIVSAGLTAVLRGEEAYHGSTNEESARAQTECICSREKVVENND